MKNRLLLAFTLTASVFGIAACTDAGMAKISNYGEQAEVTCYSAGKVISYGISSGIVANQSNSDGFYFKDLLSNKSSEPSGDCSIVYSPDSVNMHLYSQFMQTIGKEIDQAAVDRTNANLKEIKNKPVKRNPTGRSNGR